MEPDKTMMGLGALAIGLVIATAILSIGAIAMTNIWNQTESEYGALHAATICLQGNTSNTSACGLTGLFLANTTPLSSTGNWTLVELASDGIPDSAPSCYNTTSGAPLVGCGLIYNFTRPAAYVSADIITYTNTTYNEGASGVARTDALPTACLDAPVTLRYTKNYENGSIEAECYNGAAFQRVWYAAPTNGTNSENSTLSEVALNWTMFVKTANYKSGGSAATFQPINYVLTATTTFGSWIGTVVIAAIAAVVIGLVFVVVRVVRGGGSI